MKLHPDVQRALDDTGKSYELKAGRKHIKIFLDGKLCTVQSHGRAVEQRSFVQNTVSAIRRAARR